MIKYILIWLFIFIIGSLIVSFLIYPNSFQSFKENIRDIYKKLELKKNNQNQDNILEINMTLPFLSCSFIEMIARSEGLGKTELKEAECKNACGIKNLDYYNFKCKKDKLYCYCYN